MTESIKKGDLVFLRSWPGEDSGDWTISSHPPLLVLDLVESRQLSMFGGSPHIEKLVLLDAEGVVRTLPAGYFVSADTWDLMVKEIHRVSGR